MNDLQSSWKRYLNNTASKADLQRILDALEDDEQRNELEKLLETAWVDTKKAGNKPVSTQIKSLLAQQELSDEIQPHTRSNPLKIYAVAASVSLLILVGIGWYINQKIQPPQIRHLIVHPGEKAKSFTLPDGTTVWLNVGSTIQYPENFATNRAVKLNGEAFFEVAKSKQYPFHIQFKESDLWVTGTQFNIKSYREEAKSTIHIKEGSVEVISSGDTSHMLPDNRLTLFHTDSTQILDTKAFKGIDAWRSGKLVFRDANLSEVLYTLKRYYNVSMYVAASPQSLRKPLTATYDADMALPDIIQGLAYLYEMQYEFVKEDSLRIRY